MDTWNKMNEELLRIMKTGIKGKKSFECANSLVDIDTSNKREDLFVLAKELYTFSKKALNIAKPIETPNGQDSPSNIEDIINRQLTKVLPGLLKTALSDVPSLKEKEESTTKTDATPSPPVRHTVTLTKAKPTEAEGSSTTITELQWTDVVRSDLKGSLKSIPVKKVNFINGAATLDFTSKAHMEEAEKTLSAKYAVSAKSQDQENPYHKLTIFEID